MLISFQPGSRFGDLGDLRLRGRRLDEDHVGAGCHVGAGAIDRGRKSLDRDGVGARDDDEIGIVQRIAHRLELLHHLGGRHERLVVVVPALLRERLILEMKRRDARALEAARGLLGVERIAVAGVGVGDDRHVDDIDHGGEPVDDLVRRNQPEVGHAGAARDRAARGVDRREARLLDQPRRQPVERARRDDGAARREHGPQSGRRAHVAVSGGRHDDRTAQPPETAAAAAAPRLTQFRVFTPHLTCGKAEKREYSRDGNGRRGKIDSTPAPAMRTA